MYIHILMRALLDSQGILPSFLLSFYTYILIYTYIQGRYQQAHMDVEWDVEWDRMMNDGWCGREQVWNNATLH